MDLASLNIVIKDDQVVRAAEQLGKLATNANLASGAAELLTAAFAGAKTQLNGAATAATAASKSIRGLTAAANTNATAAGKQVKKLSAAATAAYKVAGAAGAATPRINGLAGSLGTAGKAALTFGERMLKARTRILQTIKSIALFAAGFAVLGGIASGVAVIKDFEQAMAQVGGIAISTSQSLAAQAEEFDALEESARSLGATTRFTATQAAEAQLLLARAGFEVNEIMAAQASILSFATANAVGLSDAASITANTIRQFGLEAGEAGRVVDVLTAAANNSNANVLELAQAMNKAAPFAANLGVSVEETGALLGVLARQGIKASSAGTNLRGVYSRLIKPVGRAQVALERLAKAGGVTTDAFDVTKNSLEDIFKIFKEVGASAQDLFPIFGRLNVVAATIFTGAADTIGPFQDEMLQAEGAAKRLADIMEDTLSGSMYELLSATQELVLKIGDAGLLSALRGVVEFTTQVVRSLADVKVAMEDTSKAAVLVADALYGIAAGIAAMTAAGLIKFIERAGVALVVWAGTTIVAAGGTTTLAGAVYLLAGAVWAAVPAWAAVGLAVAGVVFLYRQITGAGSDAADAIDNAATSMDAAEASSNAATTALELLRGAAGDASAALEERFAEIAKEAEELEAILNKRPGQSTAGVIEYAKNYAAALLLMQTTGSDLEEVLRTLNVESSKLFKLRAGVKAAEEEEKAMATLGKAYDALLLKRDLLLLPKSDRADQAALWEIERKVLAAYGDDADGAAKRFGELKEVFMDLLKLESMEASFIASSKAIGKADKSIASLQQTLDLMQFEPAARDGEAAFANFMRSLTASGKVSADTIDDLANKFLDLQDKISGSVAREAATLKTKVAFESLGDTVAELTERTRLLNDVSLDAAGREAALTSWKQQRAVVDAFKGSIIGTAIALQVVAGVQKELAEATAKSEAGADRRESQAKAAKELAVIYKDIDEAIQNVGLSTQEASDKRLISDVEALARAKYPDDLEKSTKAVADFSASLDRLQEHEKLVELGQNIGAAFADGIQGWVTGLEKGSDALKKIALQIADILFQQQVTKPLTEGFGKFFGDNFGSDDSEELTERAAAEIAAVPIDKLGTSSGIASFSVDRMSLAATKAAAALASVGGFGFGSGGKGGKKGGPTFEPGPAGGTALGGAFSGGGAFQPIPSAKGNLFANSILKQPTYFRSGSGPVVGGELADEAIMPLKRGADGSLGVANVGGGGGGNTTKNYNINFNVTGSPEQFRQSKGQIMRDLKSVTG